MWLYGNKVHLFVISSFAQFTPRNKSSYKEKKLHIIEIKKLHIFNNLEKFRYF